MYASLTKCQGNLIFISLNFSFLLKIFLMRNFPNISVRMRFEPVRSQLIWLGQTRQFCCMKLITIKNRGHFEPDNICQRYIMLLSSPQRSNECACLSHALARGNGCTISIETSKRQNGGRFKFRGMCFISQG